MTYSRTNELLNKAKSILDEARSAAEGEDKLPAALCKSIGVLVGRTEWVQWRVNQKIKARAKATK